MPRRARNHGRGEEDCKTSPTSVGALAAFDHALPAGVMPTRTLQELTTPAVADGVSGEASDFTGDGRHHDDERQAQSPLAGGDPGRAERGCADEGQAGPRGGDSQEED